MNLQIEYADKFPEALKAPAEKCLRDAIAFLENTPRPTALPDIPTLIPNFSEMEFKFGVDTWPHGLFSRTSMKGWCVLSYKASGDLLINSEPVVTVVGVDPNICTTASIVYTLDQYFIAGTYPEIHLHRQLSYLDSVAATNKAVRSLLDDYEQAQKDQAEAERLAVYKAQFPLKHQQYQDRLRKAREIKTPAWFWAAHPDATVSQHESEATKPKQQSETAPQPKAIYCSHTSPGPQPPAPPVEHPEAQLSEDDKKALATLQAQDDYMRSCCMTTEDYDL